MSTVTMMYKGQSVDVISKQGGWSTVLLDNGSTRKVRNSELVSNAKSEKMSKAEQKAARLALEAKVSPKPAKAAKAAKPAKAAKAKRIKADDEDDGRLIKADLANYHVDDAIVTASGRKAVDIADEVATQLRGCSLDEAYRLASAKLGVTMKSLHDQYDHLNPGMQRMNLGNRCRGADTAAAKEAEKAKAAKAKAK